MGDASASAQRCCGRARRYLVAVGVTGALKTTFYKPLGFVFLALAALGAVLPVLPTTPFALLAAWCFARSSEKWHRRLLQSRLFGPLLRDWEQNRCVSRRTKLVALTSMAVVGGASVVFAMDAVWLRALIIALLLVGAAVVLSLRTCEGRREPP